jgi:hypothetical protein
MSIVRVVEHGAGWFVVSGCCGQTRGLNFSPMINERIIEGWTTRRWCSEPEAVHQTTKVGCAVITNALTHQLWAEVRHIGLRRREVRRGAAVVG